tara:strand:+ start:7241 stop:7609 length:369 start_codon:yes stop_codon:yes gene_type:complete
MVSSKPRIIEKPWGQEEIWGDIPGKCTGKFIQINPGQRLSRQYHEKKDESICVLEGCLRLEIGEDPDGNPSSVYIAGPGFSYDIPAGTIHRFCSQDNNLVRLVEVSTYYPNDVIRLCDDYKR